MLDECEHQSSVLKIYYESWGVLQASNERKMKIFKKNYFVINGCLIVIKIIVYGYKIKLNSNKNSSRNYFDKVSRTTVCNTHKIQPYTYHQR